MARAIFLLLLIAATSLAMAQRMPFGSTSRLMISMLPECRSELKITKDQDKKIQERMKKMADDAQKGVMPPGFSLVDGMDMDLSDILDEKQLARLEELFIQANGGFALVDAKVAPKVNLTQEQKDKINNLKIETMREGMQAMQTARSAQAVKDIQKKRDEAAAKAEALLTPEQKAVFDSLKGKPFKFKT